jgi:hypothetical protein
VKIGAPVSSTRSTIACEGIPGSPVHISRGKIASHDAFVEQCLNERSTPRCRRSAPTSQPKSAIVAVEFGADSWAIADAHRSYHPRKYEQARALASSLLAARHRVAVGLGQVLMPPDGLDVEELFHPCSNLDASQRVLAADYAEEYRATSAPSEAAHEQLALDPR